MQKIKFAVVGYGHIGKRHASIISEHPDCELVAVVDAKSKDAKNTLAAEVPYFYELEAFLSTELEVDVVNICTPNGLHAQQAQRILDARKHVVIEKPMALRKSDCEQLIHKALQVSRQVFVVMQNRYSPPVEWLKGLIETRQLGTIYMVQMNCYWNRDDRYYQPFGKSHSWHGTADLDGGVLFTQFAHFIDIMYWVFGDIQNVQSRTANFNHTDTTTFHDSGMAHFEFVNGGMGSINYSTAIWDQNFESSITVIAEKGTLKIGGQYMDELVAFHVENMERPHLAKANAPNDYGAYKGSAANHHFVVENVVEVLRGK
ncbi:MAG: Gfo/Idh/MocA family oxidoreductase, partial [Bacteroidota bacterium]